MDPLSDCLLLHMIDLQLCSRNLLYHSDTSYTGKMDYEGQKLAELLFYWIILSFGAVGWVIGYFQQDFTVVFQAWLVGVVLSIVVSTKTEFYKYSLNRFADERNLCSRFASQTGHFTTDTRSSGSILYLIGDKLAKVHPSKRIKTDKA